MELVLTVKLKVRAHHRLAVRVALATMGEAAQVPRAQAEIAYAALGLGWPGRTPWASLVEVGHDLRTYGRGVAEALVPHVEQPALAALAARALTACKVDEESVPALDEIAPDVPDEPSVEAIPARPVYDGDDDAFTRAQVARIEAIKAKREAAQEG